MQIVSFGDNLHEMPKYFFSGKSKKSNMSLSSAETVQIVVKVKCSFSSGMAQAVVLSKSEVTRPITRSLKCVMDYKVDKILSMYM